MTRSKIPTTRRSARSRLRGVLGTISRRYQLRWRIWGYPLPKIMVEHCTLLMGESVSITAHSTQLHHPTHLELASLGREGVVMVALGGGMQVEGVRSVCQQTLPMLGNRVDLEDRDGIIHTLVVLQVNVSPFKLQIITLYSPEVMISTRFTFRSRYHFSGDGKSSCLTFQLTQWPGEHESPGTICSQEGLASEDTVHFHLRIRFCKEHELAC